MLQFLAPAFVIGFLGILIPVLVHFWNTSDKRIVKVGSIRWIKESDSVKVRRFKVSEILLMLLRIAIVCLLVLLISDARTNIYKSDDVSKNWILVDPSLKVTDELEGIITNQKYQEREVRWLEPNFSLIENEISFTGLLDFWGLLKMLDVTDSKPDSILVLSRSNRANFKGVKPNLHMVVDWVTIPYHDRNSGQILSLLLTDSLLFFSKKIESGNLILEQANLKDVIGKYSGNEYSPEERLHITQLDTLQLKLVGDKESDAYKNMYSVIRAVDEMSLVPVVINNSMDPQIVVNIKDSITYGTHLTFIFSERKRSNRMIFKNVEVNNLYHITQEMTIDNMLKYDFVEEFYRLIIDSYGQEIVNHTDFELPVRTIQPKSAPQKIGLDENPQLGSLSIILWSFLLFLLFIERIISYRKNQ